MSSKVKRPATDQNPDDVGGKRTQIISCDASCQEDAIKVFFSDGVSGFEKLSELFQEGELDEFELGDLLEHYLMFYPQFFQFLNISSAPEGVPNEKFHNEVVALFSSTCVPLVDLIYKITIYSSITTIQRVSDVLLDNFNPKVRPQLVLEFILNAVTTNKTQCFYLPSPKQCAVLLDYTLAELTTNSYNDLFSKLSTTTLNLSKSFKSGKVPPKGQSSRFGKSIVNRAVTRDAMKVKDEINYPSSSRIQYHNLFDDTVPEIVEKLLRILAAILGNDKTPNWEKKAHCFIMCIESKISEIKARFHARLADVESKKSLAAIRMIMDCIQRRFPGFSWNECSTIAHILPLALRESVRDGGPVGVTSSLFIGSRRQLLRPVELLSISDFDDILHRTLTDLHQLIITNSASDGFLTPTGQSKLKSPIGEIITSVMSNLLAKTKTKPYVMARQLPLLSIFISNVLQRTFRQFRDAPFLTRYLEFSLDVLLGTAPEVFKDVYSVQFFFQCFLRFFENLGKTTRNWCDILEKCALALLKFTEVRPLEASKFLAMYLPQMRLLVKRCTERKPGEMGRLMDFLLSVKNVDRAT